MKQFDLNIEKILEDWEVYHALREIIANALDEQILSATQDIDIYKMAGEWHVRDYGRGITYNHLTQNENPEKLQNPKVIGKFGIGLKDALATFDRKGIKVTIRSKHGDITLSKAAKEGFSDIVTLHAQIAAASDSALTGTDVVVNGCTDDDLDKAKKLFIRFSGETVVESTKHGDVVSRAGGEGNIYINGVRVAQEENFLFSYNITVLSAAIKKALNRERSNVGRTAYTDSVKKILLACTSPNTAQLLSEDLKNINLGTNRDELSWIDVQEHAVKILNQSGKYLFITSLEAMSHPDMVEEAKASGRTIVTIPENLKYKIQQTKDLAGNPIADISQFVADYNDSFEFEFVEPEQLTQGEKAVFGTTGDILALVGGKPSIVESIRISSKMRKDLFASRETLGAWDSRSNSIIILRNELRGIGPYSGTLIHEALHAGSGATDISRSFETELTEAIGKICAKHFEGKV